jgi:hypothetical protein
MTAPRPLLTDVLAAHTPTPASASSEAVLARWVRAMRCLPEAARRSVAELRTLLTRAPTYPAVLDILAGALARSSDEPVGRIRARLAASRVPHATRGTWLSIHAAVAEPGTTDAWDTDALGRSVPPADRSSGPITAVRLAASWALLTEAAHRTREDVGSVIAGASDDLRRAGMTSSAVLATPGHGAADGRLSSACENRDASRATPDLRNLRFGNGLRLNVPNVPTAFGEVGRETEKSRTSPSRRSAECVSRFSF